MSKPMFVAETIKSRLNRRTGSRVALLRDDILKWVSMCEAHGGWSEHETRSAAESWMSAPWVFCPGCQEVLNNSKQEEGQ